MTHVATAVITATNTPKKRQQSFAIKSRIEIFENTDNAHSQDTTLKVQRRNYANSSRNHVVIVNGDSSPAKHEDSKAVTHNGGPPPSKHVETDVVIINGSSTVSKHEEPKVFTLNGRLPTSEDDEVKVFTVNSGPKPVFTLNGVTPKNDEAKVFTVNGGPVTAKSAGAKAAGQRYRNVVTKAPSISISVAPWTPGAKVVTDSNQDEVQRILAHRRKLIESSIEAEARSALPQLEKQSRPLSLDFGDEGNRESAGASLDVQFPRALDLARHNVRMLWRDVRGVDELGLVESLEKDARTRQEAKFELMLSEGTFLHGLNSLNTHYMRNIQKHIPQVVTEKDYDMLFKYVEDVRLCSEAFLTELDTVWQSDPMLNQIYPIVADHATNRFQAYVRYCRNMVDMSSHLRTLTANNKPFAELLSLLASRKGGQRLTLDAFLTAPMQRITKLPLLLRTIMDKTDAGSEEHAQCAKAYEAASKIAQECDEVVNERKRVEEVLRISQEIEFAEDTRAIPIVAPSRALISQAYVKHFAFRDGAPRREKLHLILFNDLLLVTKKKSEMFLVVDWCLRDVLAMKEVENGALYGKEDAKQTNPVVFTILNNSQDKKLDLVVTFKDQNLRKEWLAMLAKEEAEETDEEQMIALQEHIPDDQSQLAITPGDVIRILQTPDEQGWCLGELLSDGSRGRFPVEKTTKIKSSRVKAANLKANKEIRAASKIAEDENLQPAPDDET